MEWTVVVVLIALAGLVASVLTPAIRLNTSVTRLAALVDSLDAKLGSMESSNTGAHRRIWTELAGQKAALGGHETRITVLEKRG